MLVGFFQVEGGNTNITRFDSITKFFYEEGKLLLTKSSLLIPK